MGNDVANEVDGLRVYGKHKLRAGHTTRDLAPSGVVVISGATANTYDLFHTAVVLRPAKVPGKTLIHTVRQSNVYPI